MRCGGGSVRVEEGQMLVGEGEGGLAECCKLPCASGGCVHAGVVVAVVGVDDVVGVVGVDATSHMHA